MDNIRIDSKWKKATNLNHKRSRKSIKSDNLHVPLTPSTFRKIKTSSSRSSSTVKSRSSSDRLTTKFVGLHELSQALPASEVPENVAVHFASFYKNQNQRLSHNVGAEKVSRSQYDAKTITRNSPKMEFTRQMVYKLENSAGTQNYGRQVSELLNETVESPGFDLKLPPADNCAPCNNTDDYYPLWYKDPNKLPQISRNEFERMKNKYRGDFIDEPTAKEMMSEDFRNLEKSVNDFSDSELELKTESDVESDGEIFRYESLSEHETWSSRSSSATDNETEDEKEKGNSIDFKTEVENEESVIELKVASNLRRNEELRV